MNNTLTAIIDQLTRLGLAPDELQAHEQLLSRAISEQRKASFKIIDTCRFDNGSMLTLPPAADLKSDWAEGYIAFVLAAGAASRYSQPLHHLSCALEDKNHPDIVSSLESLAHEGALTWPLPQQLATLVSAPAKANALSAKDCERLSEEIHLPKALMPCVREGTSFLELKHLEHLKLRGLSGELFVTPPGKTAAFSSALAAANTHHQKPSPLESRFLEQGPALSTIRFHRDGSPVLDSNGEPSVVPAGHGAIAKLFPTTRQLFPTSDALFIRNIDNIMGTGSAAIAATAAFLSLHRQLLTGVRAIRAALAKQQIEVAAASAETILRQFLPASAPMPAITLSSGPVAALWRLQASLFHTPLNKPLTDDYLRELFARPVNLMGQVPNIHNDVGGTPCFIDAPNGGAPVKISLELPHVSGTDRKQFLENSLIATHFNPGFCAVEIPQEADYYSKQNRDFWLMAEKVYRGEQVVYYETVLYELLGNSSFANTVFVEVPRLVFNPHKALRDAMNQSLNGWLDSPSQSHP